MNTSFTVYNCDLCNSTDASEIVEAKFYTKGQPLHVCNKCGFVYVKKRRSAEAIAASWSNELFGEAYTAYIPAIIARITFVIEMIDSKVGLSGKKICDIGAGEGLFLDLVRKRYYNNEVYGIEPSTENCRLIEKLEIPYFNGTIEEYTLTKSKNKFDIITIMWTLENCQSCLEMIRLARSLLSPDGYLIVATGSRILVPFKKPLHYYLSKNEADTHAFRFSANTLSRALLLGGFIPKHVNRYIDNDVLCIISAQNNLNEITELPSDSSKEVLNFFKRWHTETQEYYLTS